MRNATQFGTLFFLVVVGCSSMVGDDPDTDPPGTDPPGTDPSDPTCEECSPTLTLGRLEDGTFVAHSPDTPWEWEWGPQGGSMITPVLAFDSRVREGQPVSITVEHFPVAGAAEAFSAVDVPFAEFRDSVRRSDDGRLVVGPLPNQLGWGPLDGTRVVLRIAATDRTFSSSITETVQIGAGVLDQPSCEPFPIVRMTCPYRAFAGEATIVEIAASHDHPHCPDARTVAISFEVSDSERASMCLDSMSAHAPHADEWVYLDPVFRGSCLDAAGIREGGVVPAEHLALIAGHCVPTELRVSADLEACACD